jgi:hypothetical protein
MHEWCENLNGNHVYVLSRDDMMTVYLRNGEWFGVYEDHYTADGFQTAEEAMAYMEKAVLDEKLDLLAKPQPLSTNWRKTKTDGYHCVRGNRTMTVKQATSGKWYLVINQTLLPNKWFASADEAMWQGDQL